AAMIQPRPMGLCFGQISCRRLSRRQSIKLVAAGAVTAGLVPWNAWARRSVNGREYHVCLSPAAVLQDPPFVDTLARAGVSCVWLAGFFYGHWPWSMESLSKARDVLRRAGLQARIVSVPLGHPGDSLGARDGTFPLTPPSHWRLGTAADGKRYSGTSLHEPATAENVRALHDLRRAGFSQFSLDDDFRLARSPGEIGGCFCEEHRERFLQHAGFSSNRWTELLDDVRARRLTAVLRQWVEFTCDELTRSFRAQQKAAGGDLGIMVMYLGAEKAGIRLRDYRGVPIRVGELMFDDNSFGRLKGKTDELFSALFHRRFVAPEQAYSETTAFPADRLSAQHLSAKLVISTLADVRHTMFMSGVTPFPKDHWSTLSGAMKQQADFHAQLAGHRLRGPFKHYWGEASRFTGDDRPFSLFLAAGVPFEVTERPARDGWTFLSDADAAGIAAGGLVSKGTRFLCRPGINTAPGSLESCEESMAALFALKHRILPSLRKVPYVLTAEPAILGWYPSARAALLWNPTTDRRTLIVRYGTRTREVTLAALESTLLPDLIS
ncbi:MAG TPA: hypothetical protein VJA21_21170, partial [Verrucomicrobiae bacterium]